MKSTERSPRLSVMVPPSIPWPFPCRIPKLLRVISEFGFIILLSEVRARREFPAKSVALRVRVRRPSAIGELFPTEKLELKLFGLSVVP